MYSWLLRLAPKTLWITLGGLLLLGSTMWYIQYLRTTVEEQDIEIIRLTTTLLDVINVAENAVKELDLTKKDHAYQLEILQDSMVVYTEYSGTVSEIKGRINNVKSDDDGVNAPIIIDTLRVLNEATNRINKTKDTKRAYTSSPTN